jgi:Immunity protein Imm1
LALKWKKKLILWKEWFLINGAASIVMKLRLIVLYLRILLMPLIGLNAENRTIVTIFGHLGAYLTIGGGAGQYVIYASLSDGDLWNVVSSDCPDSEELVMLNAGGQEGYFKSKYIVDRLSAISAASFFFSSGQLDDSLKWERQAEDC